MRLAELAIPARPEYVSLARLVIGSIADDRYELTDDQLDNLKLAISEACTMAIESTDDVDAGLVHIDCEGADDRLEILIDTPEEPSTQDLNQDLAHVEQSYGLPIIGSLVDNVAMEAGGDHARLRMTILCDLAETL